MSGTMAPETAREAWLRGNEDAVRYFGHGNPTLWKAVAGSDPTEDGYAERVFGALAPDWKAGWSHGAALCTDGNAACGCQDPDHMEGGSGHTYLGVRAGERKARDESREVAFPVCGHCARTCMAGHLIEEGGQ